MRLIPLIALLFVTTPVFAAPVLFDDRGAFNAAVGPSVLFTDFELQHVPFTYDFIGEFNGFRLQQEGFEIAWGETLGVNGLHTEARSAGLYLPADQQISAIGFDLLSAWMQAVPTNFASPPPERVPTDVFFGFRTVNGVAGSAQVTQGVFFGALLYDDAFELVTIATGQPGCMCQSGFTIDNLAVQHQGPVDVPEPSTVALFGLGLAGVLLRRRAAPLMPGVLSHSPATDRGSL